MNDVTLTVSNDEVVVDYHAQICARCVLPATFPEISFSEDGLCSYCLDEAERVVTAESTIRSLLHTNRDGAERGDYDCLMLYSGGKDSSMALVRLRRDFDARPLAFTLDNGFLSAATSSNMRAVLDALRVDHVVVRPSRHFMSSVYRSSMTTSFGTDTTKYSTAACGSCISVVLAHGLHLADGYNIPFLSGGWTPGQFTTSPHVDRSFLHAVIERHFIPLSVHEPALGADFEALAVDRSGSARGLLNPLYADYDEEHCIRELNEIGWRAPVDTDSCSTNCRLNGLLIIDHLARHGFHPYVYELAHHVRLGVLSRDEALAKMSHLKVTRSAIARIAAELGVESPLA